MRNAIFDKPLIIVQDAWFVFARRQHQKFNVQNNVFFCFFSTLKRSLDMLKLRKHFFHTIIMLDSLITLILDYKIYDDCNLRYTFALQRLNKWVCHIYNWPKTWGRRPRNWKTSKKSRKKLGKRFLFTLQFTEMLKAFR